MTSSSGFARASKLAAVVVFAGAAALGSASGARAQTLAEVLPDLVKISKKMKSAEADVAAAREKAREALGDWFPKLDLTGSYGYERQFKGNNTLDTSEPPREFEAKITQLLWDFGSTNRTIDNARLSFDQARAARDAIEQTVVLEGIVAYLDLMRRTRLLNFSRGSEENVKRQTELEDARVQRGSGFSTDVLQSKRQLASAQAARARAEGALQVARNRYLNVYDKLPDRPAAMAMPRLPLDLLPPTLNEVVDIAGKENPQLKAAKMTTDIARNNVSKTFSDKFAPTINLIGEHGHKNDFDGTLGNKNERMVKVEGKYSFNLGLTAINTLRASEFTLASSENKYGETLDSVQEQARNSWQELDTSKQNFGHLTNEVNIAAEFLELARKERTLGRRSLIDVLAGETAFINAQSDAASAETDMSISVFKLLSSMGRLSIETATAAAAPRRGQAEDPPAVATVPPVGGQQTVSPGAARARAKAAPAATRAETPAETPSVTATAAASESSREGAPDGATRQTFNSGGDSPAALPPAAVPEKAEAPPAAAAPLPSASRARKTNAPAAARAEKPAETPSAAALPPTATPEMTEAPPAASESSRQIYDGGGDSPAAASEGVSVLYALQKVDLRAGTSIAAPAIHVLNRCDPVQYVDGRLGWMRVRAPSPAAGGEVEGWVFGQFLSQRRAECELKWVAR